jgi:AcrR family transcriptional regulator
MVSQRERRGATSRARLLAAAAEEFAARGFDGAKVDRIASRARLNKAMLYYHFASKAALFRLVLTDVFAGAAEAVSEARRAERAPDRQLCAFIAALSESAVSQPHFPTMWMREIAEGGRHLDATVVAPMRRVLDTLAAILDDGRRAGVFRPMHPLIAQLGIVAPLLFFAASAPIRERFREKVPRGLADVSREALLAHVQATTLAALRPAPARPRSRRQPS